MDLYQNYSTTDFHRKAQAIASNIQKISQNVSSMQRMLNQLGNSSSAEDVRNQLNQIQHYTGQLAKDTNQDLKELNRFNIQGDQRPLKLQREKLTSDFSAVLNQFQTVQRTASSREKERLNEYRNETQHSARLPPPNQMTQVQLQEFQQDEESNQILLEREKSIRQLESDILDVNQIFKDLATMVYEQGEIVDSIEAHVESAQGQVERGSVELHRALGYQERKRKKFLVLLAITTIIIILLITFYETFRRN